MSDEPVLTGATAITPELATQLGLPNSINTLEALANAYQSTQNQLRNPKAPAGGYDVSAIEAFAAQNNLPFDPNSAELQSLVNIAHESGLSQSAFESVAKNALTHQAQDNNQGDAEWYADVCSRFEGGEADYQAFLNSAVAQGWSQDDIENMSPDGIARLSHQVAAVEEAGGVADNPNDLPNNEGQPTYEEGFIFRTEDGQEFGVDPASQASMRAFAAARVMVMDKNGNQVPGPSILQNAEAKEILDSAERVHAEMASSDSANSGELNG